MLAFSALILAILLLPGVVFRYAYLRSNALRKTVDFSLLSELVFVLLPSLLFHSVGLGVLYLISRFSGYHADLGVVYGLLSGQALTSVEIATVERGFGPFVVYTLAICTAASVTGKLLQVWIVERGWDERYKLFQIFNDWDKYFTGHVVVNDERRDFDYVQVDVVVGGSEGDILYTGSLANYSLNRDQGIDRIFMEYVYRRPLSEDLKPTDQADSSGRDADPRYYAMPGDYLVLPFSQVKNLNLSYKKVKLPPV